MSARGTRRPRGGGGRGPKVCRGGGGGSKSCLVLVVALTGSVLLIASGVGFLVLSGVPR